MDVFLLLKSNGVLKSSILVTLHYKERAIFSYLLECCHLLAKLELLLGIGEVVCTGSDTHVGDEVLVVLRTCLDAERECAEFLFKLYLDVVVLERHRVHVGAVVCVKVSILISIAERRDTFTVTNLCSITVTCKIYLLAIFVVDTKLRYCKEGLTVGSCTFVITNETVPVVTSQSFYCVC